MPFQKVNKLFYGWWIVASCAVTFGIAVGVPYYNLPFFYDYFQKAFGWKLDEITLGFPLAALLTLWVGPILIPRFSTRYLILAGTALTALALAGFSFMHGSVWTYYALYFVFTVGYLFAGPIPHQILISQWFKEKRGTAMGIVYVGVGLFGALGAAFVKPLTQSFNFHVALRIAALLIFITWPLALFVMKDRPADKGLFADGASAPPPDSKVNSHTYSELFSSWAFWLLLIGSAASIGSIGSINFHMKFVFRDAGFRDQKSLDGVWSEAQTWILVSSIAGRLIIGYLADLFSKKWVMTATYFLVAGTIPLLLMVHPSASPLPFAVVFGFAMGADYMLIPLMAAERFGVNSLARAMAIILPVNTIGQTWCPELVSILREYFGGYEVPMLFVFGWAIIGAIAIIALPHRTPAKRDALSSNAVTA